MPLPSKKRSHSLGRSDLMGSDLTIHDVYQTSGNGNNLFPVLNLTAISINNPYPSAKTNLSVARPKLLQYIEENIIGKNYIFQGPWGLRRSKSRICFSLIESRSLSSDLLWLHCIWSITAIHRELHQNLRASIVRHSWVDGVAVMIASLFCSWQIWQHA